MGHFGRALLGGALGLAAAALLAGVPQAAAAVDSPVIMAQKSQTDQGKPPSPPAPAPTQPKMKRAAPPAPQMERNKSVMPEEDIERAGTKKLGGEVIRNKEE